MAAKTIKGITIEIDGKKDKLGKALKDLDNQSKNLAASLKYVDQLLELDPGNTELITEKQGILADSIETTSKKLESLRDVQDQVKQQYADGKIGQRAYLNFQAEIVRTEQRLKELRAENERFEASLDNAGGEARDAASDLDRLESSARGAADAGGDLSESFDDLTSGSLNGVAGLITGTATALIGAAETTEEYREEMAKLDVAYSTAKLSAEAGDEAYRILYRTIGETDQSVEAAQQIALLADSTEDVVAWASLAPGVVAKFGDALQPETFFEAAHETLKLGEATGAYTQLLEGTGYSVEVFNKGLAACNTEQEKQQYMLEITKGLLGDAAAEYEERNKTVMESRDADARFTEALSQVGEAISPVITDVKNFGASVLEWFVPVVQDAIEWGGQVGESWDNMKEGLGMLGEGFSLIGEDIKTGWGEAMDWIGEKSDMLGERWEGFKQGLEDLGAAFEETGEWIAGNWEDAIETVKGLMDFEWNWPDLKLPHFNFTGEFSLNPLSVPKLSVSWYAQGGILTNPTLFGFMGGNLLGGGEAGQEAVLPLDSFYERLETILTSRGAANPQLIVNFEIAHFENRTEADLDELAQLAGDKLMNYFEREEAAL